MDNPHRIAHETSNVQAVLDGDLDGFLLFSYRHAMTFFHSTTVADNL